jgi:hypothetical protein
LATYTYPNSAELDLIEQVYLPRLEENRPVFTFFPKRSVDFHILKWEQRDNYLGLAQIRGLNGEPPKVKRIGHKQYQMAPGVYGEHISIDELEMTSRRAIGTFGDVVSLDDLVTEAQEQLLQRELDRIESIIWTLLATGTFSVSGPTGAPVQTDTYSIQTLTAGVTWATVATATPIANFRAAQLLSRGYGVNFGAGSTAWMNRATANSLFGNTNAADLGGKKSQYGGSITGPDDINRILMAEDLPSVAVYDEGYLDDSGTFQLFVPNNRVVLIGKRPNQQNVGEYLFTRNANNEGFAPGPYTVVQDTLADVGDIPRKLVVHRGHNGGPVIYFPSAVVAMTV